MRRACAWVLGLALASAWAVPAGAGVAEGKAAFLAADYGKAWAELKGPARAGDAEAEYWIGVMYSQGAGVERDYEKAAEWYRKAAEQGHPEAMFNLGFQLYREGRYADAAQWLLRAAGKGMGLAEELVSRLYAQGLGLPKNADLAYEWALKAADRGVADAQFDAALMCVARLKERRCTYAEAYKWFAILAKAGYPGAKQNLDRLAKEMAPEEIAKGKRLAEAWRPGK